MAKGSEWVRVKSEDELRPGMAIEIRPCLYCGRTERRLLMSKVPLRRWTFLASGERVPSRPGGMGWITSQRCRESMRIVPFDDAPTDSAGGISQGRWFRLADDQLTDLSETRELETAR